MLKSFKTIYFIPFVFFWFVQMLAFGQNQKFPKYQTVQNKFIQQYRVGLVNNSARLIFEKRPDGWYVRQVEFFPKPHTTRFELWWSLKDNAYIDLAFDKKKQKLNHEDEGLNEVDSSSNLYDLFPYYGYKGWELDVLKWQENQTLSTSASFLQAMCYVSLANNLVLEDGYTYDTSANRQVSNQGTVLNNYVNLMNDAEMRLLTVQFQEANFLYNDIHIKDHIRLLKIKQALNQSIYFNDSSAVNTLSKRLYSDDELAYYRNILISTPKNSVLFVSGEIDAFPLLFLRYRLLERIDITILNRDWLADEAYQKFVIRSHEDSSIIGIVSKDLCQQKLDFVRVLKFNQIRQRQRPGDNFAEQKVRLEGLPDNLQQIENFDLAREYSELRYLLQFVSQDVNNQLDNGLTRYNYFPTDGIIINTDSSLIQWKIDAKLLSRGDLVFLDIIAQNISKRPICFVSSTPQKLFLGINDLKIRGLVMEIVDNAHSNGSVIGGQLIDPERLFQNLMYDFSWPKQMQLTPFHYYTYFSLFRLLAHDLSHRDKFNGTLLLVDQFFKVFDETTWQDASSPMEMAEYFYIYNQASKGDMVMNSVRNSLNQEVFVATSDAYATWEMTFERIAKTYNPSLLLQTN